MRQVKRGSWYKKLVLAALLSLVMGLGAFMLFKSDDKQMPSSSKSTANKSKTSNKKTKETLPLVNLQPTINAWAAKQSGMASVVVYDLVNNKTIASLNPNNQYFTASIYKLYVAYIGYQKVADGTYSLSNPYLSGYTRGKCLEVMIRNSYSPCGEKMWAELGKESLTAKLKTYGLTDTSMTALQTSAHDATIILKRLFNGGDLSQKHRKLFLDSLKTQSALYRRGLPSGFNKSVVYNKVGWNELIEWHDAAVVTLPNGRGYVISVFTKNIGSKNIAELGRMIETKLL